MKKSNLGIILLLCLITFHVSAKVSALNDSYKKANIECNDLTKVVSSEMTEIAEYNVTATMYNATTEQCDSDPLITAGMYEINPEKASEHKWIAMSRDMLTRWGGDFDYGDKVLITGAEDKDGIYTVTDTMNKRYTNRIDILETKGTPLYMYDNVKLRRIV